MVTDGLRRRNVGEGGEEESVNFYETIRHFDAFTKVAEEAQAPKTVTGGFFSALAFSGNWSIILATL